MDIEPGNWRLQRKNSGMTVPGHTTVYKNKCSFMALPRALGG